MRTATLLMSAMLVLMSVGAVSAMTNDLTVEVTGSVPHAEFLACYSLGIPYNYCVQLYFACVALFGAIPGGYTFCYYV